MSTLKTNNIEHLDASTPSIQTTIGGGTILAGVTTATNGLNVTGDITATSGTFSGNVSIGGTLKYEDVTNIDSVGIITAQSGIRVPGGRIGIGTDNPVRDLQLGDNTSATEIISLQTTTAGQGSIYFGDNTATSSEYAGLLRYDHADDSMQFRTVSTERMRIGGAGGVNVGSGVLSSASIDGNIVVDEGIYIGTYSGDNQIRSSSAGGGSATLYIGNAAIQVSSDRRLKKDIEDTQLDALDAISKIKVKDFAWDDPTDTSYNNRNARGKWTGLIAQELVEVLPFVVNAPRKEEDGSINHDSEARWTLDQSQLCPVLIKAIQQQQTIINDLKTRLAALESA